MRTEYSVSLDDELQPVVVEALGGGRYSFSSGDGSLDLDVRQLGPGEYHLLVGDRSHDVLIQGEPPEMVVHLDGRAVPVRLLNEQQLARAAALGLGGGRGADGSAAICAPMPGKVVKLLAAEGETVAVGAGIVVVEAMKMENELKTPVEGVVKKILVAEGQNVDAGEDLVLVE